MDEPLIAILGLIAGVTLLYLGSRIRRRSYRRPRPPRPGGGGGAG